MVMGIGILLLCQLAGEIVVRGLGLPVPGPVLGLLLLLGGLFLFGRRAGVLDDAALSTTSLGRVAGSLLQTLGCFFVPAGVGVVGHLDLVGRFGIELALALLVSTALTLVVTVWVFIGVARLTAGSAPHS